MEELFSAQAIVSIFTLTIMEIVLGIDNIVFISIISGKLPAEMQGKARNYGLVLALIPRILLLFVISWLISLEKPLFTIDAIQIHKGQPFGLTGQGLILLLGGLFLIYKATTEIHHKLEGVDEMDGKSPKAASFGNALFQIVLINLVFSLDSILTAVGLVSPEDYGGGEHGKNVALVIMIIAVVLSVIIMMLFAGKVSHFVNKHPTVKMLALSFLLMIGVLLVIESVEVHVPKGYVYFAMAFSVLVEMLNLRLRKTSQPVNLHDSYAVKNLKQGPDNRTTPKAGTKL
jgi:predicted tellurium resistance membrane protein TerC